MPPTDAPEKKRPAEQPDHHHEASKSALAGSNPTEHRHTGKYRAEASAVASQKLTDAGHLPKFDIHHPNAKGGEAKPGEAKPGEAKTGDAKAKPGADKPNGVDKTTGAPLDKKDWTVGVELAANIEGEGGGTAGGDHKWAELQKLAAKTKDSSMNIVVHVQKGGPEKQDTTIGKCGDEDFPGEKKADAKAAKDAKDAKDGKAPKDSKDGNTKKGAQPATERYLIHDGKIERLPDEHYANAGDDIKGLVKDMQKAPSDKTGLIIQSHGAGENGLGTDHGNVSLQDTAKAIKDGLQGSGHDKLDMLDYDSCTMADTKVLDVSAAVAKDIVASSTEELGLKNHDGQNLNSALSALADNTKMSGVDFGNKIVDQAKAGGNGTFDKDSTPTLDNFDMSKYPAFKQALDNFGTSLTRAGQDGNNAALIRKDINDTSVPAAIPGEPIPQRDLPQFARRIEGDVDSGKFSGDTKDLKQSAKDLRESFDAMATNKWADPFVLPGNGGLAAKLPGQELLDPKDGDRTNPMNRLKTWSDSAASGIGDRKPVQANIDEALAQLDQTCWAQSNKGQMKTLHDESNDIYNATNPTQYGKALDAMQKTVTGIQHNENGTALNNAWDRLTQRMQGNSTDDSGAAVTPGWDAFVAYERTIPSTH